MFLCFFVPLLEVSVCFHSFIHPISHSFIHPISHSFIHSFIHPISHSFNSHDEFSHSLPIHSIFPRFIVVPLSSFFLSLSPVLIINFYILTSIAFLQDILIDCGKAVTSISVNSLTPYHLAIGCEDSTVRVFDRRAMSTESQNSSLGKENGMFCQFRPDTLADRSCRVTSLQYRYKVVVHVPGAHQNMCISLTGWLWI